MTDTADTLYEQEVTGNTASPKTKADWSEQISGLRRRLQRLFLGGVGRNNVSNVYGCLDDEEVITDLRMTMNGNGNGLGRPQSGAYYSAAKHHSYRTGEERV